MQTHIFARFLSVVFPPSNLIKQKAKAHHNNYPSQGLAERRASVNA